MLNHLNNNINKSKWSKKKKRISSFDIIENREQRVFVRFTQLAFDISGLNIRFQ